MANPTLELLDVNGTILEANDDWQQSANKQAIIDSGIPPTNDAESAIVRTLTPANYTAIVRGANGTIGIAVVEVYALN
jgi:Trk K+ transport system NAD-binding subunit